MDEIRDEKRKADSELDALCTQINYLLYEADFDKVSIRQAQDKLVKAKEKIFGIMTELRGVYRTRGEHRKADDVEVDMDLYQSRVGKILQEVGDKLKESAKRAVKPESDKDSFETENLQKWLHGQSRREFEAERFPEGTIDETPAQTPQTSFFKRVRHVFFFHSKSPERKMEAGTRSNLERITVPKFNGDKTKFERFWTAFSNCVDKGCESSEIKMLRLDIVNGLESCLVGKAADLLEGLDYSETAYATAKMRLQRKFGGPRRQVQNQIEKLRSMKPLHVDNVEDLEKFSDALENIVVLLQTQGKLNELQPNSSLYTMSLQKIPEEMLSQYYRWLGERRKPETLEVFKDWILDETDYRVKAAEAIKGLKPSKKRFETHLGMVKHADQSKSRAICCFCKTEGHEIWKCVKFKALHTDDRWKIAKDQALCFRCLSNTHKGSSCRRFRECGIDGCKSNHRRLLHALRQPPNPSTAANNSTRPLPAVEDDPAIPSATGTPTIPTISPEGGGVVANLPMVGESSIQRTHTATLTAHASSELVSLRTVPVCIKANGKKVKVNAVLDDASTGSLLNEEIAIALGLQSAYERETVRVLNETVESFDTMPVEITLESVDGQTSMALNVYTCARNVTGNYQAVNWNLYKDQWSYLSSIKFPEPAKDPIVDILIGVEYSFLHSSTVDLSGQDPKGPVARLGPLGWTCIGSPNGSKGFCHKRASFLSKFFVRPTVFDEINATLKKFWEVENSGINVEKQEILTSDEKKALNQVQNSLRLVDGRYQLEVPWKNERPVLPDNYTMALKRLENTELKLLKHPEMAQDYQATITSYLQQGYIRKLLDNEMKQVPGWLLPHFPVFRPERQTTKTRIVFDASAKHTGVSLNDEILPGPKLQNDLVDILLRFRRNPIALVADISQMYLRIQIAPPDRRYFRFLWRNLDMKRKPEVYEFERVVFGKKSAPFEAQYTIQEHARTHQSQFPAAAETILESTYMDDSMDSTVDEQNAIDLYHQLSQLWEKAGMHARKWLSNSTHVLKEVPQEDRLGKVDFNHEDLPSTKTLGVVWIAETDVFTFNTKPPPTDLPLTKRNVLKNVATLFDPLGLVTPYTIRAKILLQVMWTRGLDWDEAIDGDLTEQVQQWFSELDDLKKVQVHRCLQPRTSPAETTIHTFVDASKDAFGAVSYVRNARLDGVVENRFIASKTKVAPLATMSIPRLELSAAVMGLRLAQTVSKVLQMAIGRAIFWSDSTNTLWWIRGNGRRFKPFVANRVGEIQAHTDPFQWR